METLRPMSILPAIKCSTCGVEIEISSMGEHICTPSQEKIQSSAPMPAPASKRPISPPKSIKTGSLWERKPLAEESSDTGKLPPKIAKVAPPRIDPTAANKPYIQRELLTPADPRGPAARAITTPRSASRPPKSPMIRSMTSPVPRIYRPPSPQMSSGFDSAFPPFPTSRPTTSHSKLKSSSTSPQGYENSTLGAELHAEPESYVGPRSPRTTGGANVMQRMNGIAPGPFNAKRSASNDELGSPRISTTPKALNEPVLKASEKEASQPVTPREDIPRPSSPALSTPKTHTPPVSFIAVAPPTNREGRTPPQRPVRPEPLDGFLAMLKSETEASAAQFGMTGEALRLETRSSTFPLPPSGLPNQQPNRRPSEPEPPARTLTAPSLSTLPSSLPLTSELEQRAAKTMKQGVSPMPPLSTQPKQSYQHTVHSPSDSASSTSSTRSYGGGSFKSDVSPPISATSSISMLSTALEDSFREQDPSLSVPSLQIKAKPTQSRLKSDELKVVPQSAQDSPALRSESLLPMIPPVGKYTEPLESPVMPLLQGSRLQRQGPAPLGPLPPAPKPPRNHIGNDSASRPLASRPSGKRPGTATKHHCRGCKEPITGKSVKAADGRLTGRWHKQCFVCKTCSSPFATADFYVINNDPYCEQHYHSLNNSLCANCDRGIEGPYLETQQGQKFHPGCFTCHDCRKVLSDDYFEIGGTVYCEQHAVTELRRQEGLGPKRNMERRTTRLMMMGGPQ